MAGLAAETGARARPLRPHYPCLEGLRTIGVMALFFQHTGYTTGLQARVFDVPGFGERRLFAWMGNLELGPAMFFVLSAFLLYQPFVAAAFVDAAPQGWRRFMTSRVLRVVPAYWVTLTLLIVFFRADPGDPFSGGIKISGWEGAIATYTFAQVYFPTLFFNGITAAYTLCAEVVFYLLVPLYAILLYRICASRPLAVRLRIQLWSLGVLAVFGLAWRVAVQSFFRPDDIQSFVDSQGRCVHWACAADRWFPGYLDYFALGMAVATIASWVAVRGEPSRAITWIGNHPQLLWGIAAALFALYVLRYGTFGLETVPVGRYQIRYYLTGAIVACLLLPAAFGDPDRGPVRGFLRWRPMAYTGLVSYGVYLWHQGWTDKAMDWTDSVPLHANFLVITTIAVALSLVTATLSWYGLERPITRLRDRRRAAKTP